MSIIILAEGAQNVNGEPVTANQVKNVSEKYLEDIRGIPAKCGSLLEVKILENFSFLVYNIHFLCPFEVFKNQDLVIFWKVSKFCIHF